ncbi:MAG: L,D-transpeptidase family protein [Bacteroidales bacterium]|nr:L,D-transpeptidase family protein [Bacteroidales bacterium]
MKSRKEYDRNAPNKNLVWLLPLFIILLYLPIIFSSSMKVAEQKSDTAINVDSASAVKPEQMTLADTIAELYSSQLDSCRQMIVVTNADKKNVKARLTAYELVNGSWRPVVGLDFPANLGGAGFADVGTKREGDRKTPSGIFSITHFFSKFADFNAKLEKIPVTQNTVWVDDVKDSLYNRPFECTENETRKGENLLRPKDALYDYVMVINYNVECAKGKGSAIFLHCWSGQGRPTLGCVAVEKSYILKLFDWIDCSEHPVIVMGTREDDGILKLK